MSKTKKLLGPLQHALAQAPKLIKDKEHVFSQQFEDIYFNTGKGLQESDHVFIQANQLTQRWKANAHFTVAEIGFGSGLNFLNTWQWWNKHKKKNSHLHYVSAEMYPITREELKEILESFASIDTLAQQLLSQYPNTSYGFHQMDFHADNISLTLMIGSAIECYKQWQGYANAWFLDGFAPDKNPELWEQELMDTIAQKSAAHATLSTFTVAGHVRKKLKKAGFEVNKIQGFGRKREMLQAQLVNPTEKQAILQHWYSYNQQSSTCHQVAILGAGIAGLAAARACQLKGLQTVLIDPLPQPLSLTSSVPVAMVKPHLTLGTTEATLLYWRAFEYAINNYPNQAFSQCGAMMDGSEEDSQLLIKQLLQHYVLSEKQIKPTENGLLFPSAGFINTSKLLKYWEPFTQQYKQARAQTIQHDGCWHIYDDENNLITQTDAVIVTAGIHTLQFSETQDLPLSAKYGQVSICETTDELFNKGIIFNKGYLINDGEYTHCGSTFEHMNKAEWYLKPQHKPNHWQKNQKLWNNSRYQKHLEQFKPVNCYSGIRTSTSDRLPVCGPLIDRDLFKQDYSDLNHGRHWKHYPSAKALPHLYVLSALGSRGFTTAPLLAEILVGMIKGAPLPIEEELIKAIHPNRFLYRELKKGSN